MDKDTQKGEFRSYLEKMEKELISPTLDEFTKKLVANRQKIKDFLKSNGVNDDDVKQIIHRTGNSVTTSIPPDTGIRELIDQLVNLL